MNIKSFKLKKEDDKSYQLSHPNGKALSVSKEGLSDKAHNVIKGLQKFDGGGQVQDDVPEPNKQNAQQMQAGATSGSTSASDAWKNLKSGLGYADGGDVQSESAADTPDQIAQDAASAPPDWQGSVGTQPNVSAADESPQNQAGPAQAAPQSPIQAAESGFRTEQMANTAAANAVAGQGQAESNAINQTQADIDQMPSQNDIVAGYKQKDDALMKGYMDKTIDPDRYVHSMSTGSKIAAGIGMLLTGLGGGDPTAILKRHIDNDILAQQNDQSKAMNLWRMNKEALGTDLGANLATQNQMYAGLKYKIAQASSQFKGPLAQAQAQAANAKIDQEINMNRFKLSLMTPTSDGMDPAMKVQYLVPPERQQKVFDEIDAAQNTTHNAPAILQSFDKAAKGVHAVDFVPGMQNADQKSLHALLGPTFKDVEGTVRQAAMDNMFNNTTPQFGDDANTIKTKRNALLGYIQSKSAAPTAKGFGIDLSKYPSTSISAGNSGAAQTQTMGGIQYRKVPGGWQKVQ